MEFSANNHMKLAHRRLFATLLTDPEKKAQVLELLTQEGLVPANENMSPNSSFKKSKFNSPLKKLHEMISNSPKPREKTIESPSALGRRRALQRLQSDSSVEDTAHEKSAEKSLGRPSNTPEVPYNEILKNLIVFCEVRSNGEDRSSSIKTMVRALGATVREKITRDVTHVIFKDGLYSTFRKAQHMKMHIVSVLWLDAVRRYKCQMPEHKYKPLDFDKYNNMYESQVCQEIEEEFNDVLTDEIRRSGVKKPKFQSHIKVRRLSNNESQVNDNNFVDSDDDDDLNRLGYVTPSHPPSSRSSRCSTPATLTSRNQSKSPKTINSNNNNNNDKDNDDLLVVPCSQNDSHSFTHATKSTNLSRVVEETFNNEVEAEADGEVEEDQSTNRTNIAKHVRDSFELKKVQKLKSPPHERCSSRNRSLNRLSVNDEESMNLHVTTTTEQSSNISNNKRSTSSNFAQKFIEIETNDMNTKTNANTNRLSTGSTTSLRSSTSNSSTNRRRTTIGLAGSKSKSKKSSSATNLENNNQHLNDKTNDLLNNVDNLLNNNETNTIASTTTTTKKGRGRKLFKADTVDESLFNWDKAKELPPVEIVATPSKKRKVELPPDFPREPKGRKKASTTKKQIATINNVQPKAKETLAKILDFGEKNTANNNKTTKNNTTTINGTTSIQGIEAIDDSSKENIEAVKPKRSPRKSVNSTADNTEIKDTTNKRPKRKSTAPVNYGLMAGETDDSTESELETDLTNDVTTEKSNDSFKTATSKLSSSIGKRRSRKSARLTISSISSGNSDEDDVNLPPEDTKTNDNNNKKRKSRHTISSISSSDHSDYSPPAALPPPTNTPRRSARVSIARSTPISKFKTPMTPKVRKQVPKTPLTKSQNTNIEKTPNRRSTMEFQPRSSRKSLAKMKAAEDPKPAPVKMSSIVCTRFHRPDTQVFTQIVSKLGGFVVEDEVTKRTTHLVCGGPIRTINLLRAIVRGCWVLRKDWLYKSLEAGRWLEEEDYEMVEFSPAVQKCRLEKQSFGSLYAMDLFKNCGTIFISRGSNPRCSDLEELVQLCGGRIVRIVRDADIIVGEHSRNDSNNSVCVTEKWILDSITENKKLKFKNYVILNT